MNPACCQCGNALAVVTSNVAVNDWYCSPACLLVRERPRIYFDKISGSWKTCVAISISAHNHLQLFILLGFHIGDSYTKLAGRYIAARIFVIQKNNRLVK